MQQAFEKLRKTHLGARQRLVQELRAQGINNNAVLDVMLNTPRHLFMEEALSSRAYQNTALPIGYGQTISQPYIVARMTELLTDHQKLGKVLEIGTGSGYQTAILAQLYERVFSVERIDKLVESARQRLRKMGLSNVWLKYEDGHFGWPRYAPYDGIIVTAACEHIPPALLEQLAVGGRLIAPVGDTRRAQKLMLAERQDTDQFEQRTLENVIFVPLLDGVK